MAKTLLASKYALSQHYIVRIGVLISNSQQRAV